MIFGPHDYLNVMEKLRLFSTEHIVPDCNSLVWRAYLDLYETHLGGTDKLQIVCTPGGLGFYLDPLEVTDWHSWALLGPISHPTLPFTAEQLVTRSRDIFETFIADGIDAPCIVTETFDLLGPPSHENHFLWINSPRARIHDDFEAYASGLTASRRKQMRRLFRTYNKDPDFRFDFSARTPNTAELDFIIAQTKKRWEADWDYALVQSLWPIAVSMIQPSSARFMRVYYKNELAFINAYIVRDTVLLSQSTCRNEDMFHSGLGVMIDFKAIETLSGAGTTLRHLDPTCRTCAIEECESIVIAKREVVNEDNAKPLFMAGYELPLSDIGAETPHLCPKKGWVLPSATSVIGKAA